MTRKRRLAWEKLFTATLAGGLLACAYWLVAPLLTRVDPLGPIMLSNLSGVGSIVLYFGLFAALAVVAGVVMRPARPMGALLVLAVAMAGLTLRSGSMRVELWSSGSSRIFYLRMMAELLGLGVTAAAVLAGSLWLQTRLGRSRWIDPLETLTDEQKTYLAELDMPVSQLRWSWTDAMFGRVVPPLAGPLERLGLTASEADGTDRSMKTRLRDFGGAAAVTILGGGVISTILLASDLRGQVLLALAGGFFLVCWLASGWFQVQSVVLAVLAPLVVGLAWYGLGVLSAFSTGPVALAELRPIFLVTPLDWMTTGLAGALGGFWASSRSRDTHIAEALDAGA
jgi:hypothetical protein